jgi:hypothetical protein
MHALLCALGVHAWGPWRCDTSASIVGWLFRHRECELCRITKHRSAYNLGAWKDFNYDREDAGSR